MSKDFYKAITDRRSIYGIDKNSTIPDDRIMEVIQQAVQHTPSAFNSQSSRVIVLLDGQHQKLWDITKEVLRKIVPKESFDATEEKMNSFRAGYGTVLFFEDQSIVTDLQKDYPLYRDNFPVWSQQSSGMLQFVVWTSLEIEGLGATLQHYNPLIDEEVHKTWQTPGSWKLIAELPFGNPVVPPDEKEFGSLEERVKLFK